MNNVYADPGYTETVTQWKSEMEERGVKYAILIPSNDNLERDIAELVPRPVGRPRQKPLVEYKGFLYQAAGWKTARRVVAKVLSAPRPNWGAALRQGWSWFKMDSNEGRVKCENNLLKL